MTLSGRDILTLVGGIGLAVVLLWWVFRGVDPGAVWDQLKQASLMGLIGSAVLQFSHNFLRVWRWGALLEPVRKGVPFRPMFVAVILGYWVTWLIPGRLGELVRPALLSGREGIPLPACVGTVVVDRILDGMAILTLFAVGLAVTPLQGQAAAYAEEIRVVGLVLALVAAVPLVALIAASNARGRIGEWVERRSGWVRWLGRAFLSLSRGTEALRRPWLLLRVIVYSLLAWLLIALGLWIGVRACGADITFGAMLVIMPAIALGVAIPTPGGAGSFQAAVKFGLTDVFAQTAAVGISASLLMHAVMVLPIIALGLILLLVDRVPLNDLLKAARQLRTMGAPENERGSTQAQAERLS